MRKFFLVIVTLLSFGVLCNAQYDKDVFAFRGRLALSENRYSDALSVFNMRARLDPSGCWTFF